MQVWTDHEAGRTASVASAATQVREWDYMCEKVGSFIRFRDASTESEAVFDRVTKCNAFIRWVSTGILLDI